MAMTDLTTRPNRSTDGGMAGMAPSTRRGTDSDRSPLIPLPLDIAYGLGIWIVATLALVVLGNAVLPKTESGRVVLAYVAICAATFAATYALAGVRTRYGGEPLTGATGLRFGAVVLIVGLFLDGVLLAVTGFSYPNVDAARTKTIAVVFLLAYPMAVVGPWLAGIRADASAGAARPD